MFQKTKLVAQIAAFFDNGHTHTRKEHHLHIYDHPRESLQGIGSQIVQSSREEKNFG